MELLGNNQKKEQPICVSCHVFTDMKREGGRTVTRASYSHLLVYSGPRVSSSHTCSTHSGQGTGKRPLVLRPRRPG